MSARPAIRESASPPPASGVAAARERALEALEAHFGFRAFLDGQEEVVAALLAGKDALVVMPTGGGKSLCYQLPALVLPGVTVVVSPLIALMKDQVDALAARGIAATLINSSIGAEEQQTRIRGLREGAFKLVYVAPERFRSRSFTEALREVDLSLFAIDEAHCLSQWGHDFRPDYLRLGAALDRIGRPQTAAFTATATPEVRADILDHLGLREPLVTVSGFERPNLALSVTQVANKRGKFERIRAVLENHRTGIVYCATRKGVEEVAAELKGWGASFIPYHGGMEDGVRERAQDLFSSRERDVVVATNAFGMGIDRPDVRFVVHFDVPGSVEGYYQEAGRAGRDGEPAVCELLFNYADTRTQEFFIDGANPGFGIIAEVYEWLRREADAEQVVRRPIHEIAEALDLRNTMSVSSALAALSRAGAIERFDIPGERLRGTRIRNPAASAEELEIDREAIAEKERRDRAKLEAIVRFCYADVCRQQFILDYFGEEDPEPCGSCDICRESGAQSRRDGTAEEITRLRKALSGVARTCRKTASGWQPRFGKGRIVQMLVGSRSQEVLGARLDELSTYGILEDCGSSWVYDLLREAERIGLVRTEKEGTYPLLALTDKGAAVMRQGGPVKLRWPVGRGGASSRSGGPGAPGGDFDPALFEKLRRKRLEMAREAGGVPPYTIFGNRTLEEFARAKPTTIEAGRSVKGVGDVKAQRFLPEFILLIRDHLAGNDA